MKIVFFNIIIELYKTRLAWSITPAILFLVGTNEFVKTPNYLVFSWLYLNIAIEFIPRKHDDKKK